LSAVYGSSNIERKLVKSFVEGSPLYESRMDWVKRFQPPSDSPNNGAESHG
jgi:hypothetical protein